MTVGASLAGKTIGRYRVGTLLGRGGMGEVYRAEDTELRRPIALKVLPASLVADSDRLSRFHQEARTASALNHPHVVSIYEVGQAPPDDGGPTVHFIAMELVQGDTLSQVFDSKRVELRRLVEYLTQAAEALAAAHTVGIVHRDLKPENIMVGDGYVKVLDFGLAKLRAGSAVADHDATVTGAPALSAGAATAPGLVMGTVGYMSPEQAQGGLVDHRSDIFSFGCILYEAVTGVRPFTGPSPVDTLHRIIHAQPIPPSDLAAGCPSELQRIIRKCLAKDPDERYQSMKDLALDLRELHREMQSGPARAVGAGAGTAPPARKAVPVLASLLALIALAAWLLWRSPAGETPGAQAGLSMERVTASGTIIDAVISGDGKYIAYVDSRAGQQSLWLRQTSGTRALQLVNPRGGFWGISFAPEADAIYYAIKGAEQPLGGLYAIPTLGGAARALLTHIDSAVTFAPDGKRLAYYRVESDGNGASSLVIAGADGARPEVLVTKRPPEFFAPAFYTAPSWSPDGSRIAAVVRNSQTRTAQLILFGVNDGTEAILPAVFAEATYTVWLPDGSGIIVVGRLPGVFSTGNGGQLWLQPYPSGELRRVTTDMLEYRKASVTADGKSLLTVAFEATAQMSVTSLEGGDERPLREDRTAGAAGLAWSPDATRIYYLKIVRTELQLWTMGTDGTDARELVTNVRSGGVAASRDGKSLFYVAERDGTTGVWRASTDGSGERQLTPAPEPTWLAVSPDDRWVYFTSSRDGSPSTFKVSTAGGEPMKVAGLLERAVPSPDGRLLAGVYRRSATEPFSLGVLEVETGKPLNVLHDYVPASGTGGIAWAADGRTLLFTTAERMNLWRQPVTGGPREKVTNFSDLGIARFALAPDGRTLLLARGAAVRDAVLLTNFR